jgi:hypothetical protein
MNVCETKAFIWSSVVIMVVLGVILYGVSKTITDIANTIVGELICPDLPKSPSGLHFAQVAAPVHVHLRPSCTQSQFTRPILFNPRIMQRLMTFSMDCTHASPRSLAEAVAVVACPS